MSKNNKIRRHEKKLKQKKQLKNKKQKIKNAYATTANLEFPFFDILESPLKDITDEQRKTLLKKMGEISNQRFHESLEELKNIIKTYNPIQLISILINYGLTGGLSDDGISSNSKDTKLNQGNIELLHALVLQMKKTDWGAGLVTPDVVQQAWDLLKDIDESFALSRMDSRLLDLNEHEKSILEIQESIRRHTQTVRNWGYFSQVINISTELYSHFDEMLDDKIGFTATETINVFSSMSKRVDKLLSEKFKILKQLRKINNPRKLIRKYLEIIGHEDNGFEEENKFIQIIKERKVSDLDVFILILSHFDLFIEALFYLSIEDISNDTGISIERINKILEYFSLSPGDLIESKTEYLFLDNPVWQKPVIKIDDKYFCPLPQQFFSFVIPILDDLIEKFSKQELHDRRANYLESKINEIVKRRFREPLTISGLKWEYDCGNYETDLITFIDSHALIIEAKSQKISKSALRGAPDRIKRHVKEIFIEPSIQSKRFEEYLNKVISKEIIDDDLINKLPVDIEKINSVIRVSVTLEDFATLQANINRFRDTGWFPDGFSPCPTMNLADFETLFDFLEHPVQILHYLKRRTELEGMFRFMGDEMDYLGLYITTLLNMEKYSDSEVNIDQIVITGMSGPIDNYYISKDAGIAVEKPKPQISELFSAIFKKLEERSIQGWSEMGILLNNLTPEDQNKLVSFINKRKHIVDKTWMNEGHENIIIYTPPVTSDFSLAYVLLKNGNLDRRHEFAKGAAAIAFNNEYIKKCLVIAKNIDDDSNTYHLIALFNSDNK